MRALSRFRTMGSGWLGERRTGLHLALWGFGVWRWLAFATRGDARLYDLNSGKIVRSWKLLLGLSDQMQFDQRGRLLLLRREGPKGENVTSSTYWWRLYDLLEVNHPNSIARLGRE